MLTSRACVRGDRSTARLARKMTFIRGISSVAVAVAVSGSDVTNTAAKCAGRQGLRRYNGQDIY
tara:strand:- start:2056 stop:2247 length:192 start_codon:yes stop_codon:yes gene_type:complete